MPQELYDSSGKLINYSGKLYHVSDEMVQKYKDFVDSTLQCKDLQITVDMGTLPAINFFLERQLPETNKHKAMTVVCGVSYLFNQIDGKVCGYNCFKYEPSKDGKFTAREMMEMKHPFPKDIINSSMKGISMWSDYANTFPEIKKLLDMSARSLEVKDGYSSLKNCYSLLLTLSYIGDEQNAIYNNFKSLRDKMQILGILEKMRYEDNIIRFTLDNGTEDYVVSFGDTLEYNGMLFDDVSHFLYKYVGTEGIDKKGAFFSKWFGDDETFKQKYYHPFFERNWEFSKDAQENIVELFEDDFDNSDLDYER